jgi:hydrogenase nickel incorporation protein HypA/HybF
MHELSLAVNIVELAQEEADRRGGLCVSAIHLRMGALSGVVKDALLSAYELACEGTPLMGSRLVIEDVPIIVYCPFCCERRQLASVQDFSCSVCHTPTSEVLQGRELVVSALEVQG